MNKVDMQAAWVKTVYEGEVALRKARRDWTERTLATPDEVKPKSTITSEQFFHRCLVKALLSKHPDKEMLARELLYQQFTPISNRKKLANGRKPFDTLTRVVALATHTQRSPLVAGLSNEQRDAYGDLMAAMVETDWTDPSYALVFVREDIKNQPAVVAHVCVLLGQVYGSTANLMWVWVQGTPNEAALAKVPDRLRNPDTHPRASFDRLGYDPVAWYEGSGKHQKLAGLAYPPLRASTYRRLGIFTQSNLFSSGLSDLRHRLGWGQGHQTYDTQSEQ